MSHPYISPEQQEEIFDKLTGHGDKVRSRNQIVKELELSHDHNLGKVTMSLNEFGSLMKKTKFPQHRIQEHIKTITKHDIHLGSL